MRTTNFLLSVVFSFMFLSACQKEMSHDEFIPVITGMNTPNISASVMGRVVDELGKPVARAEVKAPTYSVFTDINGEFKMQNVGLYDNAAFIQVMKPGYFTGSRTFIARHGQTHYVEVKLIPQTTNGSISSTSGGTVTLPNGASITLPALSVVNKLNNAPYSGNVDVSIAWIDPTSADLTREMPGDLRGIDNGNAEMGLQSFGMLAVELKGSSGEILQIATGKKAALKFPLPSSIISSAPATIALWSFNETTGVWNRDGTATKVGNSYEAEVSHFSFWNCDVQFPTIELSVSIKDQAGKPIPHTLVRLRRTNNSYSSGYTDSAGVVKGRVPSNEVLALEIVNTCNVVSYTQSVGPFTANSSITVSTTTSNPQGATITGNVLTCGNTPVLNGSVELITGARVYRAKILNGSFTITLNVCNNAQAGTLVAIDSAANQQGVAAITINQGANNAGTITACGTSTNQFINFTISGTPYNLAPPGDSLLSSGNSANVATFIQGSRNSTSGGQIGPQIFLGFSFIGGAIGSFPLTNLNIRVPVPATIDSASLQGTVNVVTTEYGGPGQYIAGSFTGTLRNIAGTTFPIQCSFRVRRRQ